VLILKIKKYDLNIFSIEKLILLCSKNPKKNEGK
jgi:hypothetical protein